MNFNLSPYICSDVSEYTPYRIKGISETRIEKKTAGSDHFDGFGAGSQKSSLQAGMGEFLERRMFFRRDSNEERIPYDSFLSQLGAEWKEAIEQLNTSDRKSQSIWTLPVTNILTGKSVNIPRALVSLKSLPHDERAEFGISDSCGNSFHVDLNKSIENSMNEFAERQCLVLSWLSDNEYSHIELTPSMIEEYSLPKELHSLLKLGKIKVSYLSKLFSSHVFMAAFVSKNNPEGVYFAVGASGAYDPLVSFRKAVEEMIGSYLYTYSSKDLKERPLDDYKSFYLECNNYQVSSKFNCLTGEKLISPKKWLNFANGSFKEDLARLRQAKLSVFVYNNVLIDQRDKILGVGTKIISPFFYLHMKTDGPLNYNNRFSSLYNVCLDKKDRMPFP